MRKFSRRSFLKTAAAGMSTAGLAPSLVRAAGWDRFDSAPIRQVPVNTVFGPVIATVEHGRIVNTTALPQAFSANSILEGMADRVYSPSRIRTPMVRRDFLAKRENSDRTQRGKGDFVRVSWNDAMELVASELERVRATYGNTALYSHRNFWGTAHCTLHRNESMMFKWFNVFGGSTRFVGNYSFEALRTIFPVVAWGDFQAGHDWPSLRQNVESIVLWGADPLTNARVQSTGYNTSQWLDLKTESRKIRVVSIDPVRHATATYLGAEWVPVRPNTDVALALGMMHTLLAEELHDREFLDRYTFGFADVEKYLLGADDGQAKDADWAAEICGVPAETIRQLARDMAAKRTMIMSGWSTQRQHHGEQAVWALVTLASMLGQIGLPGGGLSFGYHRDGGYPGAPAPSLPGFSSGPNPVSAYFPIARWVDAILNPGKTINHNGKSVTYPEIKLTYGLGGNHFTQHQDTNRMLAAIQKLETIIQHEVWWTPTARFADIVLPAASDFERNDLAQASNVLFAQKRAIEPLFESRSDYDILSELAERVGVNEAFNEGKDELGWLRSYYELALGQAQAQGIAMPDFDTFWGEGMILEYDLRPGDRVLLADFRADPVANLLGTPSGKIELYSNKIAEYGYDDCPPHAAWLEPVEWVGGSMANEYPLHLVTKHNFYRQHSQMDNTWLRDLYKVADREPLYMNTGDAENRGIATGDVVRVFNARGQVLAGAVVTDDVMAGAVILPEGSWYDPAEPGVVGSLDKQGSCNVLTRDDPLTSQLAQGNIGHTAVVQVEKYDGEIEPITAYEYEHPG